MRSLGMGRPSKRAKKIRQADEFSVRRLASELKTLRTDAFGQKKTLAEIFSAIDAQMLGNFALPVRLAERMRTDDAIFVPRSNRLEPLRCLQVEVQPASDKPKAISIAGEAEALFGQEGVGIANGALSDVHACFVDHAVAIGVNLALQREDGSRIDYLHSCWPLEWVRWDSQRRLLMTRVDPDTVTPEDLKMPDKSILPSSAFEVPIIHGDGRWTIYAGHNDRPWRQNAAILPASQVFARHAFALRDWAKGSTAHGNTKINGQLPEGVQLQADEGGGLSAEAAAFLEILIEFATGENPLGISPFGSKVDFVSNSSSAWEVWAKLIENAEKAAARIYLGTDGTLGASGGAPGVDIEALFGVATTKVQADVEIISRSFREGVLEPWCALNFGDSTLAPKRVYILPQEDADAERKSLGERRQAFYADIAAAKNAGFVIDQDFLDDRAKEYDVVAPKLPELAPTGTQNAPVVSIQRR